MKVIVAQSAGFCSGVKKAVDLVFEHTKGEYKVYSLGPLIHNPQMLKDMESRGLIVEEDLDKIESGSLLLIRSHGIPKNVYDELESKDIKVVDATCHFVKKVHRIVSDYSSQGYTIVIVGEREHPEVQGILGWCKNTAFIASNANEINDLPKINRICAVAQTTLSQENWSEAISALSKKTEHMQIFNTICSTSSERQNEAKMIAKDVDIMLVIGGQNSSNTRMIFDICKAVCVKTFMIESAVDLDLTQFSKDSTVGIAAGASTPENLINDVVSAILNIFGEKPGADVDLISATTSSEVDLAVNEATAEKSERHEPDNLKSKTEETGLASDYQEMADFHKTMVMLRAGDIVKGHVMSVSQNEIIVNVGYKSDGFLYADEISTSTLKAGDEAEFEVLKVNDGEGNVILSRRAIERKIFWEKVELSVSEAKEVEGVCTEVVKGGVIANIFGNIRVFVPASQISLEFYKDLSVFLGKPLRLRLIEADKKRNRVVASQKVILNEERESKKSAILETLYEGQKISGKVMRLTDFGAFVDIGGIDGLIRINDLSWTRIAHPGDIVKVGDEIEVVILTINKETEKIALGYKQAHAHPWDLVKGKYSVGDIVIGKVVRIAAFGAFVELEPGIDGLVHISQIDTRRVESVEKALKVGQEIKAVILKIEPEQKKIGLSIKEAQKIETNLLDEPLPLSEEKEVVV